MKVVVLAVLLTIVQASPPVPRKAADPSNRAAQNIAKQANGDKTPAKQAPPTIQPISPKPDQNARHSPTSDNAPKPIVVRELPPVSVSKDWLDRLYILLTGILIVVGICGVRAAYKTLKAIETQAAVMGEQRQVMLGQLRTMQEQIGEMSVQSGILQESVGVARNTAKAAQEGANAAKESADATRDSVEAFISKERARLRIIVEDFDPDISPTAPFVKYKIAFHGNADAFISHSAAYALITTSKTPKIDDERADIFRILLPDVIDRATNLSDLHMVHAYSDDITLPLPLLMDAINNARVFLHFYAFIKYTTLDKKRVSRVFLRWEVNVAVNAMLGKRADQWIEAGPPEANRET